MMSPRPAGLVPVRVLVLQSMSTRTVVRCSTVPYYLDPFPSRRRARQVRGQAGRPRAGHSQHSYSYSYCTINYRSLQIAKSLRIGTRAPVGLSTLVLVLVLVVGSPLPQPTTINLARRRVTSLR